MHPPPDQPTRFGGAGKGVRVSLHVVLQVWFKGGEVLWPLPQKTLLQACKVPLTAAEGYTPTGVISRFRGEVQRAAGQ